MKKTRTTKKKVLDIAVLVLSAAIVISVLPVCFLYIRSAPKPYTNAQAIEKLKGTSGDYFKFIVLGDNHAGLIFNDSAALKMIRRINRENRFKKVPLDFVFDCGDVTNAGSKWDYRTYDKIRSLIKLPVISAMGNHDNKDGGSARFAEHVGAREYSFADRNSYFIVLDNTMGDVNDEQFSWFEGELKKSQGYAHRFVMLHKPPFSPYQQSWYRPELNPWSHRFMKLCERYKVDIVFSGHEHMFKKENLGQVKYLVSGGGGMLVHFPASDGGYLHYLVVKVQGEYVTYEVRRVFPPLWEFLTYYLWKEILYFLAGVLF